jgi:predicted branched-subunit amino acid permease
MLKQADKTRKFFVYWIALTIFGLPGYLWRFKIGLPTTALEVNIYLMFLAYLICYRKNILAVLRGLSDKLKDYLSPIFLLLLAAVVSLFVTSQLQDGLGLFKAYFIDALMFVVVLLGVFKEKEDYRKLIYAMAGSAILVSLVGILQYANLLNGREPWISEVPKRISSVFEYPNAVGLYLAPILGFIGGYVLFNQEINKKERIQIIDIIVFV